MRSALHGGLRIRCARAPFIVFLFMLVFIGTVATAETVVLTNTGEEIQGSLTGLAPVIRLSVPPDVTFVGPAQAFDISTSTIRQITVDFPRVVVETADHVYVGPYSAFRGIDEKLVVHGLYADTPIDFASVRAISLQGDAIHPVPWEWLGDRFLSISLESPVATPPGAGVAEGVSTSPSTQTTQPQNWSDLYSSTTTPETQATSTSTTPWWIGLIVIGALAAVVYLFMNQ
jgi:hypothetical protein